MKHVLLFVVAVFAASLTALAQVPQKISYQGLLTTSPGGAPVLDGSYNLKFDIYNLPIGGTLRHSETHTGVSVVHGTFSIALGPLPAIFSESLYVEVTALSGPSIGSPLTFSPRSELTSAPYALAPWSMSGSDIYYTAGNIGIGTTSPSEKLEVSGNARVGGSLDAGDRLTVNQATSFSTYAAHITSITSPMGSSYGLKVRAGTTASDVSFTTTNQSGTNLFLVRGDGNVGIGTTSPSEKLEVSGNAYASGSLYAGDRLTVNQVSAFSTYAANIASITSPMGSSYGLKVRAGTTASDVSFNASNQSGTSLFLVRGDGNVGIGTTSPTEKLEVTGNIKVGSATIRSGTGSPEGAVTGNVGDLFLRTDGGAGSTFYVKESGNATNTGWVAK